MRYRWIMILLIFPALGAGQDSVKKEAKQVAIRQIDSLKSETKSQWYRSPNVVNRSLEGLVIDLNETIILYRDEARARGAAKDSADKLRDSLAEVRYNTLVTLAKQKEEIEKLQGENWNLYYQPLMLGISLSTLLLVLFGVGCIRGMFKKANEKRKANNVEEPNN